jgi:hypothetical protein
MISTDNFQQMYKDKLIAAEAAARLVKPGQHVFIGTACATPRTLPPGSTANPPADVKFIIFFAGCKDAAGR